MIRRAAPALVMSAAQRDSLAAIARSQSAAHRQVQRAQTLLLAAEGAANSHIAESVGVSVGTVRSWRERFVEEGLAELGEVRSGRRRKPTISNEQIADLVDLTLHSKPEGPTHWSCPTMAEHVGVSHATVHRIWDARGLKPHRVETFKLSNDPQFEEKLIDVHTGRDASGRAGVGRPQPPPGRAPPGGAPGPSGRPGD
jgi:transposase